MDKNKPNLRPRAKANLPKMRCPNDRCGRISTPLIKVELGEVAYITYKEEGEVVGQAPYSVESTTFIYCRHCQAIIWQGAGVAIAEDDSAADSCSADNFPGVNK